MLRVHLIFFESEKPKSMPVSVSHLYQLDTSYVQYMNVY